MCDGTPAAAISELAVCLASCSRMAGLPAEPRELVGVPLRVQRPAQLVNGDVAAVHVRHASGQALFKLALAQGRERGHGRCIERQCPDAALGLRRLLGNAASDQDPGPGHGDRAAVSVPVIPALTKHFAAALAQHRQPPAGSQPVSVGDRQEARQLVL